MRFIFLTILLLSLAESGFSQSWDEEYRALPLPPRVSPQNNVNPEEQNGKLLYPVLDPKTGKYTFDVERGKRIVEQNY